MERHDNQQAFPFGRAPSANNNNITSNNNNNNTNNNINDNQQQIDQHSQVRTLFVSGLPMDAKPRELYLLFRAYKV